MQTLNVSLFDHTGDTVPKLRIGLTWEQLVGLLGRHRGVLAKKAAPMFSPFEWMHGHPRGRHGVVGCHFGVLDLDEIPEQDLISILSRLTCSFVYVSSFHNRRAGEIPPPPRPGEAPKKQKNPHALPCGRLIFPFSRLVLASEWGSLWPRLNEHIALGKADKACAEPGRCYWAPSFLEGAGTRPEYVYQPGPPVDVDALGPAAGSEGYAHPVQLGVETARDFVAVTVSREELLKLSRRLRAQKGEHRRAVGQALRQMLEGEAYAQPSSRDNMTYALVQQIVDQYPKADPESLADLFVPSLQLMGEPSREEVVSKIQRRQRGVGAVTARAVAKAFEGERTEPYSQEELHGFADRLGVPLNRLKDRWIILKGSTVYILFNGSYRCFLKDEAMAAARIFLAPAVTAGVDVDAATDKGSRPKNLNELVRDYGTVAGGVVADLTAEFSHYDESTSVMVEAPCPLRPYTPEYHPKIARWLELLAADKEDLLNQWIAAVTLLEQPCAALYMVGEGGTGKTLLMQGLARLWTEDNATDLETALADYNDAILRCPLVFGDEVVPKGRDGRMNTSVLREFIQARTRPLKRKYHPTATMRGAVRLALAANNESLLNTDEMLSEHDIQAIADRFVFIRVAGAAKAYLQEVGEKEVATWVHNGKIAQHALWLRDSVEIEARGRFLVQGDSAELIRTMATSTGLRAKLCQWLVSFLLDPKRVLSHPTSYLVANEGGRFYVNARLVSERWGEYIPDKKDPPTPTAISNALRGISIDDRHYPRSFHGAPPARYRQVNFDLLAEWAENTGYSSRGELEQRLRDLDRSAGAVRRTMN